jgi:hypothetical protein
MRVNNPDRSAFKINCCDPARVETGVMEPVSDDFPVLTGTASNDCSKPFAVYLCSSQARRSLSATPQLAPQFASASVRL